MKKVSSHFIYFTEADARILTKMMQARNESKSAIVRKLIHVEKYAQTLKQIENVCNHSFIFYSCYLNDIVNCCHY